MDYELFLGGGANSPANAPIAAEPIAVNIVGTLPSFVIFPVPIKIITPIMIEIIVKPSDRTIIL